LFFLRVVRQLSTRFHDDYRLGVLCGNHAVGFSDPIAACVGAANQWIGFIPRIGLVLCGRGRVGFTQGVAACFGGPQVLIGFTIPVGLVLCGTRILGFTPGIAACVGGWASG